MFCRSLKSWREGKKTVSSEVVNLVTLEVSVIKVIMEFWNNTYMFFPSLFSLSKYSRNPGCQVMVDSQSRCHPCGLLLVLTPQILAHLLGCLVLIAAGLMNS